MKAHKGKATVPFPSLMKTKMKTHTGNLHRGKHAHKGEQTHLLYSVAVLTQAFPRLPVFALSSFTVVLVMTPKAKQAAASMTPEAMRGLLQHACELNGDDLEEVIRRNGSGSKTENKGSKRSSAAAAAR